MAVAETNKIITHGDGQSIATSIQNIANAINDQEKNVHLSDAQTISGAKTFSSQVIATGGVKTDKVTSTNGTEVLAYNGTTTALKGKADRPTYNGGDLALKSDVNAVSDIFILADAGSWYDRFHSVTIDAWTGHNVTIYDTGKITSLSNAFLKTNANNALASFTFIGGKNVTGTTMMFQELNASKLKIVFDATSATSLNAAFRGIHVRNSTIEINNIQPNTSCVQLFFNCWAFTTIPAIDLSNASSLEQAFAYCDDITSVLCTGMKVSFSLADCTKLSGDAARVVIDNVATITDGTGPTLTLSTATKEQLNADDITTLTNKGWNLA